MRNPLLRGPQTPLTLHPAHSTAMFKPFLPNSAWSSQFQQGGNLPTERWGAVARALMVLGGVFYLSFLLRLHIIFRLLLLHVDRILERKPLDAQLSAVLFYDQGSITITIQNCDLLCCCEMGRISSVPCSLRFAVLQWFSGTFPFITESRVQGNMVAGHY